MNLDYCSTLETHEAKCLKSSKSLNKIPHTHENNKASALIPPNEYTTI